METLKEDKGKFNGSCNMTACQEPPAIYFNHSTRKYYCVLCAFKLNRMNPEAIEIFGHDLCTKGQHND